MKKILISILTILGVGISFCSADASCPFVSNGYVKDGNDNGNPVYVGFQILNTSQNYLISSFNVRDLWNFGSRITNVVACYGNSDYISNNSNCSNVSFSYSFVSNNLTVSINTEFIVPSGNEYLYFLVSLSNYSWCSVTNSTSVFSLDTNFNYLGRITNFNAFAIQSLCYEVVANTPKFKVNYGNTSYEYELEDNLSIYLKSPTTQSGNTFTYAGSTGINLYFNGSSQFYNKDKLFLNTPSWFNSNVFTPICL